MSPVRRKDFGGQALPFRAREFQSKVFLLASIMANSLPQADPAKIASEFADDPDFQELLVMFYESLRVQRGEFVAAFHEDNRGELARKAHQLKGAGGGYGFPELSESVSRLEDACKHQSPSGIATGLEELLALIDRILPA